MGSINVHTRELLLKIVYYGTGRCGKTTTLRCIHKTQPQDKRTEMLSLATATDRTLYFDYLPITAAKVGGFNVRLQLYTVPGQVYYRATREIVLRGADAVVFVADSQRSLRDSNLVSLEDLAQNLELQGTSLESMPLVFQYNKRDLPDISTVEELDAYLNYLAAPAFATVAETGDGVKKVHETISVLAIREFVAKNRP